MKPDWADCSPVSIQMVNTVVVRHLVAVKRHSALLKPLSAMSQSIPHRGLMMSDADKIDLPL